MTHDACALLTPAQAAEFGLDLPPKQSDALFGTTDCKWTSTDDEGVVLRRVYVSMFTNNPTLESVYARRAGFGYFEMSSIDGYPAAVTRPAKDALFCSVDVKTAERQSVSATNDTDEPEATPQQGCDMAKRVASAVLANIPPKR